MRWLTLASCSSFGVLLLGLSVGPAPSLASATAHWELLSGPVDPPPFSGRAVHDSRRHRMIYVEGVNPGEIWTLSLPASGTPAWRRFFVRGTPPPVRNFPSVVYDSLADRVLMFGGKEYQVYNDVWALSLTGDAPTWSQIQPIGVPPAARKDAAAIFDPLGDRMVLWGGNTNPNYDDNVSFSDTWSLELAGGPTWRKVVTPRAPGVYTEAYAAYDPWNRRMLLHAGRSVPTWYHGQEFKEDVWALALSEPMSWDSLPAAPGLRGYFSHAALVDPIHRELITGCGLITSPVELWALSLQGPPTWRPYSIGGGAPNSLSAHAMVSPERGSVIQFDPYAPYELDLATAAWTRFSVPAPSVFPSRRGNAYLFVDPAGRDLFAFGDQFCLGDLYRFGLESSSGWENLPIGGSGPANCGSRHGEWLRGVPVFDPIRHRILEVFGTDLIGRALDQVWALPLDPPRTWTRLDVTGPMPAGRFDYSLTYDPVRDRVLLFGGAWRHNPVDDQPTDLGDLWALSLDSLRWTPIAATGGPSPRREAALMYDAASDRILLVGGRSSTYRGYFTLMDSWYLPLGSGAPAWTPLGPDVPIGSRYEGPSPALVLDSIRDRLLAWDGSFGLYALPLAAPLAWQPIRMSGDLPTQRGTPGLSFDTSRDRMIMFGGAVYGTTYAADLRALHFSRTVAVDVLPRGNNVAARKRDATIDLAILSAAGFSPDSVVISSVTLAGAHVTTDALVRGYRKHGDLNGDGIPDLPLQFPADSLKLSPGEDVVMLLGDTPSFAILARVPLETTRPPGGAGGSETPDDLVHAGTLALRVESSSTGGLVIQYSLASPDAPAHLEMFDIAGRRVARRDLAALGAGTHSLVLDDSGLRPGVFIVRLAQGRRAVMARAAVLR